ncbi:MAG: UDP-N-acetylglucosamine 2-epimerase (non-hydrolyzing) [Betaproteobacteria bacterium]|nr:MAG: UDP-N-acetylglucosamine 2-epimerase (non-hydrolyzing) [Betaproteobacteria bacterium]
MKKIALVAGARPNFMKIAPIMRALEPYAASMQGLLIHTGQHYDPEMSDVFFADLGIRKPDRFLNCGGGSHAQQTARIMMAFEEVALELAPDWVVVVGDVNSTVACSLVAKKLHMQVAHVEAGLRSGDREMPEEINRIVTDSISDRFFVTEPAGEQNLLREGHAPEKIHYVGHVMIDNLLYQAERLAAGGAEALPSAALKTRFAKYGVVTLHRPSNVDDPTALRELMAALGELSASLPLVFPVHPRTRQRIDSLGVAVPPTLNLLPPLGYTDFLNLWKDAKIVITDSGGLQEETTGLGVPCVTMRENTERPVTIEEGTNVLVGRDFAKLRAVVADVLAGKSKQGRRPRFWDGKAAERICEILAKA